MGPDIVTVGFPTDDLCGEDSRVITKKRNANGGEAFLKDIIEPLKGTSWRWEM